MKRREEINFQLERKLGLQPKLHPLFANIDDDVVLSCEDIAQFLCVHLETVRRWCRSGKLANYNFGGHFIIMGSDFKEFCMRSKSRTKVVKEVISR